MNSRASRLATWDAAPAPHLRLWTVLFLELQSERTTLQCVCMIQWMLLEGIALAGHLPSVTSCTQPPLHDSMGSLPYVLRHRVPCTEGAVIMCMQSCCRSRSVVGHWHIAAVEVSLMVELHGFSPRCKSVVIAVMCQRKDAQSNVAFGNGRNSSSATETSIELPCLLNTGAIASCIPTDTWCRLNFATSAWRSVYAVHEVRARLI